MFIFKGTDLEGVLFVEKEALTCKTIKPTFYSYKLLR